MTKLQMTENIFYIIKTTKNVTVSSCWFIIFQDTLGSEEAV